jgi:plastocyanin
VRTLTFLSLSLVALASCGGGEPGVVSASAGRVFTPKEMTVAVGDTVTWEIQGDEAHTVTAYDDGVPEGASRPGVSTARKRPPRTSPAVCSKAAIPSR